MTAHTANGKATTPRKAARPRAAKTSAAKTSPDQPKTPQPGRDAHGKFQRGNTGGIGNPYARQVAILRRELMETTSPTDIRNIGLKLKALALEGNVQAAKLLFAYTLGLPTAPESPDREHFDELRLFLDEARLMATDNKGIPATGALGVLLSALRFQRQQKCYEEAKGMAGRVTASPAERKAVAHLSPAERQKAYANCGVAKDWPAFPQSHYFDTDWIPWPNESKDAATQTPPAPSSAAPSRGMNEVNPADRPTA